MKSILSTVTLFCITTSLAQAHGMPSNPLGISSIVTIAPTLYISDFSKSKTAPKERKGKKTIKFIEDNLETLKEEVAKGEGETLETLATFFTINNKSAWKAYLQKHYQQVFFLNKPRDAFSVYVYIEDITRRNFH